MRILTLAMFAALSLSSVAMAAQETTLTLKAAASEWQAKDHWSASTDALALGYGSAQGFMASARPKLEYFIVDRLAVGGLLGFAASSVGGYLEMGPSATYHFWEEKKFSSYGTTSFTVGGTGSAPVYAKLSMSAGLNYNIDNFAFGPSFGVAVSSGAPGLQVGLNVINLYLYF